MIFYRPKPDELPADCFTANPPLLRLSPSANLSGEQDGVTGPQSAQRFFVFFALKNRFQNPETC
jgi:hypothetical protein